MTGTVVGTMGSVFFAMYFDAIKLAKDNYRATMTAILLTLTVIRGVGYFAVGEFSRDVLVVTAILFPSMLLGIFIGNRFHHGMSETRVPPHRRLRADRERAGAAHQIGAGRSRDPPAVDFFRQRASGASGIICAWQHEGYAPFCRCGGTAERRKGSAGEYGGSDDVSQTSDCDAAIEVRRARAWFGRVDVWRRGPAVSSAATMKYLLMSLLIAVVATL